MKSLFGKILRWFGGHFTSFVVIVAILAAGHFICAEVQQYLSHTGAVKILEDVNGDIGQYQNSLGNEISKRLATFNKATTDTLTQRIAEIDKEIAAKTAAQRPPVARRLSLFSGDKAQVVADFRGDTELSFLTQERDYLRYLLATANAIKARDAAIIKLEQLRRAHLATYSDYQKDLNELSSWENTNPVKCKFNPLSTIGQRCAQLEVNIPILFKRNQEAHESFQRQQRILNAIVIVEKQFELRRDEVLQKMDTKLSAFNKELGTNWLGKILQPVSKELWPAFWILLSIIFTPLAIKAVFYFIIAPAASRRPAIRVLDRVRGPVLERNAKDSALAQAREKVSEVSQSVTVDAAHELLIHPEYLQSSAIEGKKETKWLLSTSLPLSSLVSGMYALTQIRTTSPESYVISSTKDPLIEIGLILIDEGSAIVFKPHYLIGLLQRRDKPVKISREWRFGMHAWLTLQFRFLIFHGPVTLIVKGCRGVRREGAGTGRSISQAATMGFSATVAYSVIRCETFYAYFSGKQELFNDSFSDRLGFYVYEEMPYSGKAAGITGRGIEGVVDAVLKVFGV